MVYFDTTFENWAIEQSLQHKDINYYPFKKNPLNRKIEGDIFWELCGEKIKDDNWRNQLSS